MGSERSNEWRSLYHFEGYFENSCNFRDPQTWLMIGEESMYGVLEMCCTRDSANFGNIAYVNSNGFKREIVATSLIELMQKLYFKYVVD